MSAPTLLLSAAEPSGDAIGANLIRAFKRKLGPAGVRLIGAGGPAMAGEGFDSLYDIAPLGVAGLRDALFAVPAVLDRAGRLAALAETERPNAAILIDGWGFHHQAATRLRRRTPSIPIVRYATPQVWASRPHRAAMVKPFVDLALTLFPFEPPFFTRHGIDARFAGHPLFETRPDKEAGPRFRAEHGLSSETPLLAVLIGSRPHEWRHLEPVFARVLARAAARVKGLRVVTAVTPRSDAVVREKAKAWPGKPIIVTTNADKRAAFAAADVGLAASGTVTLELAAAGTPAVIAYRVGPLTYQWAIRRVVTKHAGVVNYVAGREVAPEFIQDLCRESLIAPALIRLLTDPVMRREMGEEALRQVAKLRGPDDGLRPGERAAGAVLEFLDGRETFPPVFGATSGQRVSTGA